MSPGAGGEWQGGAIAESVMSAWNLQLGYGTRLVLRDVNFAVRPGDFWFVIGPNGQGKTTLLRALLGRIKPLGGRFKMTGDFARRDRLGFVPQSSNFNRTLPTTVREFVLLGRVGLVAWGRGPGADLDWALHQVGMEGMESHDFWSLSGGQRQRALVARALIRRPSLLIADEPTSGMDLFIEDTLLNTLSRLNRSERLTVLMVTHDIRVAARFGTHVALVYGGRVEAGPAREILEKERLERAFQIRVEVQREATGRVNVTIGSAEEPS